MLALLERGCRRVHSVPHTRRRAACLQAKPCTLRLPPSPLCRAPQVIVFFTTARLTQYMAALIDAAGLPVLEIHSRKSQVGNHLCSESTCAMQCTLPSRWGLPGLEIHPRTSQV